MGSFLIHRVSRHCKHLTRQLGFDSFMVNGLAGQGVDLYFCHRHRDVLHVAVQAQHQCAFVRVLHHLRSQRQWKRLTAEASAEVSISINPSGYASQREWHSANTFPFSLSSNAWLLSYSCQGLILKRSLEVPTTSKTMCLKIKIRA